MAFNVCPICGAGTNQDIVAVPYDQHRCRPETLAAIDASMRRDPDQEDPRHRTVGQRLADGFAMLSMEDYFEQERDYDE